MKKDNLNVIIGARGSSKVILNNYKKMKKLKNTFIWYIVCGALFMFSAFAIIEYSCFYVDIINLSNIQILFLSTSFITSFILGVEFFSNSMPYYEKYKKLEVKVYGKKEKK